MKRLLSLSITLLLAVMATAQVQQGVVKTRGRMVNGRHVAGQGLSGATVTIQGGNSYRVQNNDGSFSFPVTAKTFLIQGVQKKGYELVDADAIKKPYRYSDNPLCLVMETPEQMMEDKLAAERKIRRTLEKQLHEREDELEALREEKKLTDEQYHAALEQLYNQQSSNESHISQMAAHYALIDYDQLKEEDRIISEYILNGQLNKADSLLNKGDFTERRNNLLQLQQVNQEQQETLDRRKALAEMEMTNLGNYCYNKHLLFKMRFQNDSAAYYIASRADLDDTNVRWQLDAGEFLVYMADFARAKTIYERGTHQAVLQYGETDGLTGECYLGLGSMYEQMGNDEASFENIQKAINIFKAAGEEQKQNLAWAYSDLGLYYFKQDDYSNAIDYYEKAIKMMNPADPGDFIIMAQTMVHCGVMYGYNGDQDKAREYYQAVIKACDSAPDGFITKEKNTALMYLGFSYYGEGDYHTALEYYKKAENGIKSYGSNIKMGERNTLKSIYYKMGIAYEKLNDYDEALTCFLKVQEMEIHDFGNRHPKATTAAGDIGDIYRYWNRHDEALDYYQLLIEIREEAYGDEDILMNERKNTVRLYSQSFNDSIAAALSEKNFERCITWLQRKVKAIMITDGEGSTISEYYVLLAYAYQKTRDYQKALGYVHKAISLFDNTTQADIRQTAIDMETDIRYELAITTGEGREELDEIVLVIVVDDNDTPAAKLGLTGEYFILEWAGWNMESDYSLIGVLDDILEKPKDVVLMKDGQISSHHFDGIVGGQVKTKRTGKEIRDSVIAAWRKWKHKQ